MKNFKTKSQKDKDGLTWYYLNNNNNFKMPSIEELKSSEAYKNEKNEN